METRSVADILGPWKEPEIESGLIQRVRANWSIPAGKLSNAVLATFVRQEICPYLIIAEAKRRIDSQFVDDTELYEGELAHALAEK